ncbi:MAG: putative Ig domain-containing protein [Blastocatellia bacterium]
MNLLRIKRAVARAVIGVVCVAVASLAQFFYPPWHARQVSAAPAVTLHGEAALQQLKTDGGYASLAAALVAARAQTNAAPAQAAAPLTIGAILTQQQKLTATDGAAADRFGTAVSLSGDTAVIGAPFSDVASADQGSAYVFVRNGTSWSLQKKLTANDGAAGDRFGISVAISGDTVVVGAEAAAVGGKAGQGAAYVFVRSGPAGNADWTQQQKLVANDGAAIDDFGHAVAISGDTVAVSAPFDDAGTAVDQGSAYVFTRSGTTWMQQQKLLATDGVASDRLGTAIAVSGETVVVGAGNDTIGGNTVQGSAYVFVRSGARWTEQQQLTANDGAAFDNFGASVALSGDTVVVGAPFKRIGVNSTQGAAYVFTRGSTTWTLQQRLTAADGADGDLFGFSVALSGDLAVVGAESDDSDTQGNQGAAYVFARGGTDWTQQRKLFADDGANGDVFGFAVALGGNTVLAGALNHDNGAQVDQGAAYVFVLCANNFVEQQQLLANDGASADRFGHAVALGGDTVVVGAPDDDIGAKVNQGSAYVFTRNGPAGNMDWTQQLRLIAADGEAGDRFGFSVALGGDTLVVGAPQDDNGGLRDQGSAYVFVRSGPPGNVDWTQQQKLIAGDGAINDHFGISVALSGDTVVAGASVDTIGANPGQGSAYVFTRSGANWTPQQKLTANDGAAGDRLGISVALSGDTVVAGAEGANGDQGAVYVFVRSGAVWTRQQRLIARDGQSDEFFGQSVALSGDTLLVGATSDDIGENFHQGSAYVFVRGDTGWTQQQKLIADDGAPLDNFGFAVALSGDTAVVGAFFDDSGNQDQGSAYVFTRSGAIWTQQKRLTANDGAAGDNFGNSVALNGDTVVMGALADDVGGNVNQGSVYVFACPACPTLTLDPDSLPDATLGAAYRQSVTAGGGAGPFQFSLSDGALPPGLILAQNGQLAGAPTAAGTYRFTITATSLSSLCNGSRNYTLTIKAAAVICVSAASFLPGVAPDSIVAAFGTQLSTQTQAAASLPLPTELGGVRARVRDSQGVERLASLFFVSPGQINLLVPAGTASGTATLSLGSGASGELAITRTAPGLFAANANGQGVPAAVALRVRADGTQSFEPVARLEGDRFVPAPIDLGAAGERVFLALFGTGVRFQQNVTATVGGAPSDVLFAGAAAGFAGLDQINLALPRTLTGRGEVEVALRVDGVSANPVRVNVR